MRNSVRAVVIKDGKLLLMKRRRDDYEFYTLIGGGIDDGETPEQALIREVQEESSVDIASPKLIINLHDPKFGEQPIYLCEYVSGTPALAPDSGEAAQNKQGTNLYEPLWLDQGRLGEINLLPKELKATLLCYLQNTFPAEPIELNIAA